MKPELFLLVPNFIVLCVYLVQWSEPGKIVYWAGVCVLTVGLLMMRG